MWSKVQAAGDFNMIKKFAPRLRVVNVCYIHDDYVKN